MTPTQRGASHWPFVLGLLGLVGLGVLWWTTRTEEPPPMGPGGPGSGAPAVREVRPRPVWLEQLETQKTGSVIDVRMDLLQGAVYDVRVERRSRTASGGPEWWGVGTKQALRFLLVASGADPSEGATLAGDTYYVGMLRTHDGRRFRLQGFPGRDDLLVEDVSTTREGTCSVTAADATRGAEPSPVVARTVPSEIDVLGCWTMKAALAAGQGQRPADFLVWGRIQYGVAEASQALADSGVVHTLRLLRPGKTVDFRIEDDEEGGGEALLARMESGPSPGMVALRELRDRLGADLVLLVAGRLECDTCCGRARVLPAWRDAQARIVVDTTFARRAFAVVDYGCTFDGFFTIPHELGHTLGCCHDWAHVDGDCSARPEVHLAEAHGNAFRVPMPGDGPPQCRRTIMAIADRASACRDTGRTGLFSGPEVLYQDSLGAESVPTGVRGRADNVEVLNATGATVAGFRPTRQPR